MDVLRATHRTSVEWGNAVFAHLYGRHNRVADTNGAVNHDGQMDCGFSVFFSPIGDGVDLESDRGRYDVCSTGCCKSAFMLFTHSGDEMLEVATVFGNRAVNRIAPQFVFGTDGYDCDLWTFKLV